MINNNNQMKNPAFFMKGLKMKQSQDHGDYEKKTNRKLYSNLSRN